MLNQTIAEYHKLLTPDVAQVSQAALNTAQRERNLYFGERPLSTVLRPRLITAEHYALLQHACGTVTSAMYRLADAMLQDAVLRRDLMLTPQEEALVQMHPGYAEPSAHSRMDTFLTSDGASLQFVEYNGESPAAIAYEDLLSDVFLQLPVVQLFQQHYTLTRLPARHHLRDTLLGAWQQFGGTQHPTIAIVDWSGLPTHSEFLMFQAYFYEHGIEAVICTPDALVYRDGRLLAREYATLSTQRGELPIDLVYKRVLTSELLMHYGDAALQHPLMRAYADGKVCMVNSFRAKLLHKKSIFALLTDDDMQGFFTPDERAAIARHVPWTRVVRDAETTYQGSRIRLMDFARSNRDRLVLKPNDEYGGKGVVIGWETEADTWDRHLNDALVNPSILQERATIAYEDYPAFVNGQVQIGQRLVDSDPFLFGTNVHGCLCRLSTVTLLNVTAGGGSTVPVFVVGAKE